MLMYRVWGIEEIIKNERGSSQQMEIGPAFKFMKTAVIMEISKREGVPLLGSEKKLLELKW